MTTAVATPPPEPGGKAAPLPNTGSSSAPITNNSSSTVSPGNRHHSVESILGSGSVQDFDFKAYEGTYKDRSLLVRLSHLAQLILSSPSPSAQSVALARDALERIIPLVKQTWDVSLYMQVSNALADPPIKARKGGRPEDVDMEGSSASASAIPVSGAGGAKTAEGQGHVDIDWIEGVREAERKEVSRLDTELKGYSSNLIKESMRLTYLAFAQTALKSGKLTDILKSYANAREYSSSPVNMVELGAGVIEACLAFNQPSGLPGHISKLEAAVERAYPSVKGATTGPGDAAARTAADVRDAQERDTYAAGVRRAIGVKIRVARTVVAMHTRDYERAGREAAEVLEEGGLKKWEGKVISTSDLALIAALCTLATGSRERIRRILLDRPSFRTALGDEQGWIVDLVRALLDAEYSELGPLLRKAEPALLLCPFTSAHTSRLTADVRLRAMVQYVSPFSSVKIATMAAAFGMAPASMLKEVEGLVLQKQIKGRLDLVDGILEMHQRDHRHEMFKDALSVGKESTKSTKAALLRIRMQEAKITVDPRPAGSGSAHDMMEWVDASMYNGSQPMMLHDSEDELRDDHDMDK